MLDLVGLAGVAGRRAGRFSLGMAQRLGIAAALLCLYVIAAMCAAMWRLTHRDA